ncbi:MAG: hypothetical protein ABI618_08965 [Nitrospirota bacterium]
MIAAGIYLLGLICIEKESRFVPALFLLSIACAILIWFSYPAVFSLAGVGIALTLYCLKTQKWQQVAWLSVPAGFWLGSFALNYFTTLVLSQTPRMEQDWMNGNVFMSMPPMSVEDLMWYPTAFFLMFREPGGTIISWSRGLLLCHWLGFNLLLEAIGMLYAHSSDSFHPVRQRITQVSVSWSLNTLPCSRDDDFYWRGR